MPTPKQRGKCSLETSELPIQKSPQRLVLFRLIALGVVVVGYLLLHARARQTTLPRAQIDVSAFEDKSALLSLEQVLSPVALSQFRSVFGVPVFGYTSSAVWLRIKVTSQAKSPLTLKIDNPLLESVQVFEAPLAGLPLRLTHTLGSDVAREVNHRFFYVPLTAAAQQPNAEVMLRVASAETMIVVPIEVLTPGLLIEEIFSDTLKMGLYYGLLGVMLLYNGLLAFFLRDRIYLFYALFLSAFGIAQLSVDGLLLIAFDTNALHWRTWANAFLASLSALTLVVYSREFLELPRRVPRLNYLALTLMGVFGMTTLATPLLPYKMALGLTLVVNFLVSPLIACAGYASLRTGFTPARFYLAGYSVLLGAIVLVSLVMGGVLPIRLWEEWGLANAVKFGSAIEIIFFSFALADRIRLRDHEHSEVQAALLRAEVLRRETQEQAAEAAAKGVRSSAIASMTQSLAHDIRKPFSMLKIGIDRMAAVGDDPAAARSLALKIKEHVGRAFDDVNGMIADLLEVANEQANLHRAPVSIVVLLEAALGQTFRYHAGTTVALTYDLRHSYVVDVDARRIQRVLANILDNARQAMKGRGQIWIHTRNVTDDNRAMVEVVVGNSNSFIAAEDLAKIFEAFFTNGKRDGTGLGLAICYKFVTAHGGTIRCISDRDKGTEFIFTLPSGTSMDQAEEAAAAALPASSLDIRAAFERTLSVNPAANT